MTHDDIAFSDIPTLQRLLSAKSISSVELTDLYLSRLEKYGHTYGAVVTILHERARAEAKKADTERAAGHVRGPLHGIPFGVKDIFATKGSPTTWGAAPYRHQVFDFDATVVRKLNDAGAILLAKLAMVELAGGFGYNDADASFTGPGRSPWNRNYWSGGSSSGSAASVAAGLVAFAIGSETSGSIVFPSTLCGVTGLRPTYGRVSRHGAMALCWSLDKVGPLAHSARDAETILRAIAGADPLDETAQSRPFRILNGRRPRLGVPVNATKNIMPAVKRNFDAALVVLREFCDIVHGVTIPHLPYGDAVGTIVNAEGAAAFRDLIEDGRSRELQNVADRTGGYAAYGTLAVDYIDAQRQRRKMIAATEAAFGKYDAIVAPTTSNVDYPIGMKFEDADKKYTGGTPLIEVGNLTGTPAIAFPDGFAPSGIPTGFSLLGGRWSEAKLVNIAAQYQARTTFNGKRPTTV